LRTREFRSRHCGGGEERVVGERRVRPCESGQAWRVRVAAARGGWQPHLYEHCEGGVESVVGVRRVRVCKSGQARRGRVAAAHCGWQPHTVVGSRTPHHHAGRVPLLHGTLKRGEIHLRRVLIRDNTVKMIAVHPLPILQRISVGVLSARGSLEVPRVISLLHALDILHCVFAIEIRVL
jgi:hypothetical protein